ncbi:MAG TPA: lipoprotein signal peptidase [Bacteroidales bacterium]|jgi:signal peptidase II|nr:lipoprotein signal peptidase [Bacteroidales bacterium]
MKKKVNVTNNRKLYLLSLIIILFFLFFDQILKIWVKTHFMLGESLPVFGNWFHLRFIENEGMAFGITFGDQIGKVLLSVGRILLTAFLIYYLVRLIRRNKANIVSVVVFSLIIAGALGNIIDSLFYGLIFSESTYYSVATLFPPEGGYAPLLFGKVVDMFDFNLFMLPDWLPLFGGTHFFPAIFNVADSCVTVGVILFIIFNKKIILN